MIAVDTNVLVSALVEDDERLATAARAFLGSLTPERPGFICREVVLEVVWVLERAYRFNRRQVADVVVNVIATDSLVVETADDVATAASSFRQSGADFADLMILAAAAREEARPLYTFDRKLSRAAGATLLEVKQS